MDASGEISCLQKAAICAPEVRRKPNWVASAFWTAPTLLALEVVDGRKRQKTGALQTLRWDERFVEAYRVEVTEGLVAHVFPTAAYPTSFVPSPPLRFLPTTARATDVTTPRQLRAASTFPSGEKATDSQTPPLAF